MLRRLATTCENGFCPTIWETGADELIVQGFVVADPEMLAQLRLPAHESAVRIPKELLLSGGQMATQLDHVISMSRLPNVWIGVVPLDVRVVDLPTSSFVLLDDRMVVVELPHAEITTREPQDVAVYRAKFEYFERVSLSGDGMRDKVADIRNEFLNYRESG